MRHKLNKVKEFFSDIRTWVGLVIFFVMIGIAFASWAKLPAKVEKIEKKTEETDDKVQSVAQTLQTYIEVEKAKEEVKEKTSKEEKELMREWIKQVSKK